MALKAVSASSPHEDVSEREAGKPDMGSNSGFSLEGRYCPQTSSQAPAGKGSVLETQP